MLEGGGNEYLVAIHRYDGNITKHLKVSLVNLFFFDASGNGLFSASYWKGYWLVRPFGSHEEFTVEEEQRVLQLKSFLKGDYREKDRERTIDRC